MAITSRMQLICKCVCVSSSSNNNRRSNDFFTFLLNRFRRHMLVTLYENFVCRRHFCRHKSLSLHLHTHFVRAPIFHQHVENHGTHLQPYSLQHTITKPTLTHVEWFSLWLDYFIKLLLLLIPLVLSLLLLQFHTYSNLAHAPQSGNKTKPISESQNNTETIFLCGDAHKFTHTHDDHKMLPFAALRSQWFARLLTMCHHTHIPHKFSSHWCRASNILLNFSSHKTIFGVNALKSTPLSCSLFLVRCKFPCVRMWNL